MNLWNADRMMNRLDRMLEHAMAGEPIETVFDESKMSALETKLAKYLKMNQLSRAQLQKEKEQINEMISDISHQTKTPIANLLLYSELLEENVTNEADREMINALHRQAEKLSFLIQALVKVSRLENGVLQMIPKENSIMQLIEDVVCQVQPKALQKEIILEVQTTFGKALFDPKWTSEAVYNVLDNAVKYTNAGGRIIVSVHEYAMFIRIDIQDNGIGMEEGELPKIFGRFYKGSMAQQEEGVGLGLYLAREIITGQGGYIKVTSRKDEGSTFSIFLRNVV